MMPKCLLGVDIGTSGCKCVAMDLEGVILATSTQGYSTFTPRFGWAEQEPHLWWESMVLAIRQLLQSDKMRGRSIGAIGVVGHSWAALAVDASGRPLGRAILWMDQRAQAQCQWMIEHVGYERLFHVSGNPVAPGYTVPKLLWLKQNIPDLFNAAHVFLQTNAYLVYRLTGRFTHDLSQGNGLHVFNVETGTWDPELCNDLGIPIEKLAPLVEPCQVVGGLLPSAATEMGLEPGIPIIAGGLDAAAGALGAGVLLPGQTQEQGGQAGGMSICLDRPIRHKDLILGFHVLPGAWLLQGGTVGGGSLKWWRDILRIPEAAEYSYADMSDEAVLSPPGARGLVFLPYLSGERSPIWDPVARGVFAGLSYDITRSDMIRAIMEGNAFALHHNLEVAHDSGVTVHQLRSVGGAAQSAVWCQIKADVTGIEVVVPEAESATAKGAAIMAGIGAGIYSSDPHGLDQLTRIQRTYVPRPEHRAIYDELYDIYRTMYERLRDQFPRLSRLQM